MPIERTPPERRRANVASLREVFDTYMDTFLERRRETGSWLAEERFVAIRDEYRTLQRRVVVAYRPIRDLYRRFLEQEPQYDRRAEVYGEAAHYFEPDHTLTDWWSPLTFDEAIGKWQNADDPHISSHLERQRAVLDAFADWAGEEHPDDHVASVPPGSRVDSNQAKRVFFTRIVHSPWTRTIIGGLIVTVAGGVFILWLTLRLTGDSDGNVASPPPPACTLEGQAVELDGTPVVAARIIPREPGTEYWDDVGGNPQTASIIATTDGEGRFEADCDGVNKPFRIGVSWEMQLGSDEWCEWWSGPTSYIETDGIHRDITIQIPRDEVESHEYRYLDDYFCTS